MGVIFTSKKEAQAFFSQTFFKPKKKQKKAEKSLHEKNASRQNLRLRSPSLAKPSAVFMQKKGIKRQKHSKKRGKLEKF